MKFCIKAIFLEVDLTCAKSLPIALRQTELLLDLAGCHLHLFAGLLDLATHQKLI